MAAGGFCDAQPAHSQRHTITHMDPLIIAVPAYHLAVHLTDQQGLVWQLAGRIEDGANATHQMSLAAAYREGGATEGLPHSSVTGKSTGWLSLLLLTSGLGGRTGFRLPACHFTA
jgi:hypothetical protein